MEDLGQTQQLTDAVSELRWAGWAFELVDAALASGMDGASDAAEAGIAKLAGEVEGGWPGVSHPRFCVGATGCPAVPSRVELGQLRHDL